MGDGLGMFLDTFHCNLGGRIVVMLFLMLVLLSVWVFSMVMTSYVALIVT